MVLLVCKCCERELPDDTKFCPYCREQIIENNKSKVDNVTGNELKAQAKVSKKSKANIILSSLWGVVIWPFGFLWKHFWRVAYYCCTFIRKI